jgi:undecaprenyl-diphosphatase
MELLQATDEGMLYWFENHGNDRLTAAMKCFTFLGNWYVMVAISVLVALIFWMCHRRRTAVIVVLAALLALSISEVVKRAVGRHRPDVAWRRVDLPKRPSFPSGHSLNSMADYLTIALTASRRLRRRAARYLVIAAGFALPLVIGFSRPYLGVHWPSDVVGGWTAGLACAMLAYWADLRWGEREEMPASLV